MVVYTVKAGDTINSIAAAYGVTKESIIENNQLTNGDNLLVGQSLVIVGSPYVAPVQKLRSIAVNGYAYPYIDREVLNSALPYLTYLTLFTYGFTPEGELLEIDDRELTALAREAGVAPVMHLSSLSPDGNFSNELAHTMLNDPEVRETLIDNVLTNLIDKNYFGLDIDFEYVLPEDRDAFTDFVYLMTERLNQYGYQVFTALAPKTSSDQKGLLYEAHDYFSIGRVANWVILMTYEWGYTYGPPMAVAPLNKVREVLNYAVSVIPPNKIFMGIPNYAYDWTLPFVQGESRARSMGNVEALDQAVRYDVEIKFDSLAQTPYYNYTDEEGKEHVVWFEDARSIEAKLRVAYGYGLNGVSYWNIMREFPQNWLVLDQLFNIQKVI